MRPPRRPWMGSAGFRELTCRDVARVICGHPLLMTLNVRERVACQTHVINGAFDSTDWLARRIRLYILLVAGPGMDRILLNQGIASERPSAIGDV